MDSSLAPRSQTCLLSPTKIKPMKGIIFLEFLELVENKFGLDVADEMIESSDLASSAAYTSVGTYEFDEMVQLVTHLSRLTQIAVPDLLQVYGTHLLGRFADHYPVHFEGVQSTFEMLEKLDGTIHVEVKKLHPEAELPSFTPSRISDDCLELLYESDKPLSTLAFGLIAGCAGYFGESIDIQMNDESQPGSTRVNFVLTQQAA